MVTGANEAVERLLPRAKDLAGQLVPEAKWAYTRVGPTSCELKGDAESYQYAHRFAIGSGDAPGGELPSGEELFQRATAWLAEEGFQIASDSESRPDDVFFLTATGEPGRVTIAAGPEAILVSVATHPMRAAAGVAEN